MQEQADLPALVVCDGSLAAFVAAAIEAEASLRRGPETSGRPVLWPLAVGDVPQAAAAEATRRQAEVLGLQVENPDAGTVSLVRAARDPAPPLLVIAAERAIKRGLRRVVWPMIAARTPSGEPAVAAVAAILDRALLAARLTNAGAEDAVLAGDEVAIDAPLADLSDRQIIDLADDFALPRGLCWWASELGGYGLSERERWGAIAAAV